MTGNAACVEDLADLVRWSERWSERFDWTAIEGSLGGLSLPADYKRFVETFPKGRFQGLVTVIRPGHTNNALDDYLSYSAHWIDNLRRARAGEGSNFPHPIFPELGGVLPWGFGAGGEIFVWMTHPKDSVEWPVAWVDNDFRDWNHFPGTMCQFLIEVVQGHIHNPYGSGIGVPTFRPSQRRPSSAVTSPPKSSSAPRWARSLPVNEFDELARVIGPQSQRVEQREWVRVERRLGQRLPDDYKEFLNVLGTGTFCDIRIAGPDNSDEFDIFELLKVQFRLAKSSPRGQFNAFHPDRDGLIAWGLNADGWICNWRPAVDRDPNGWGTAMVSPNLEPVFLDELSFSSFLLKYCGYRDQTGVYFGREPWLGGPTFRPHPNRRDGGDAAHR